MRRSRDIVGAALVLLATLTGWVALLLPFLVPLAQSGDAAAPALQIGQTPLLTVILVTLCLAILLVEFQGRQTNAKIVAALGVMVAGTAALRFLEIGIPGPGGFSPVFLPIILGGYVFGPRFGFLLGAMGLLVSALITGGVGPWLPYQALAAGWVGLGAGWLPHPQRQLGQLAVLIAYGFVWGFLYGLILNLTSWPFLAGDPAQTWQQGEGVAAALRSYGVYYLATSAVWDAARAAGNVALLVALGLPLVRALGRFRDRLSFEAVTGVAT